MRMLGGGGSRDAGVVRPACHNGVPGCSAWKSNNSPVTRERAREEEEEAEEEEEG